MSDRIRIADIRMRAELYRNFVAVPQADLAAILDAVEAAHAYAVEIASFGDTDRTPALRQRMLDDTAKWLTDALNRFEFEEPGERL